MCGIRTVLLCCLSKLLLMASICRASAASWSSFGTTETLCLDRQRQCCSFCSMDENCILCSINVLWCFVVLLCRRWLLIRCCRRPPVYVLVQRMWVRYAVWWLRNQSGQTLVFVGLFLFYCRCPIRVVVYLLRMSRFSILGPGCVVVFGRVSPLVGVIGIVLCPQFSEWSC